MADVKELEEELVDRFLSSKEALIGLKESSIKEIVEIMGYGIEGLNSKTPREFAKEFLKLANLHPNVITARSISKIINKIDIEEEEAV